MFLAPLPFALMPPPDRLIDHTNPKSWNAINLHQHNIDCLIRKIETSFILKSISVAKITFAHHKGILKHELIFFTEQFLFDGASRRLQRIIDLAKNEFLYLNKNNLQFTSINFLELKGEPPYTAENKLHSYITRRFSRDNLNTPYEQCLHEVQWRTVNFNLP